MTDYDTSSPFTILSPAQSRAARAYLDWSLSDLAEKSHTSVSTIGDFERGDRVPTFKTVRAIRGAFETAGIAFIFSSGRSTGLVEIKK